MELKKMIYVLALLTGMLTLISASCNKDESEDPNSGTCDGFVSATATGALEAEICCNAFVSYDYATGESLTYVTRQDGEPIYSVHIQLNSYNGTINGPGTYSCGGDEIGYIELDIHGDDNEYYKTQSGTLTVTQLDDSGFEATFNVVTKGYYNSATVNLSGTAEFNGVAK